MKLTINSKELLKALQVVGAVINNSHTMPIATCFLFEVGDSLKITATDLDVTMTTTIPAEGSGKAAIPAKYIQDTLKALPSGPVTLEVEKSVLTITASTGVYKIPCNEASEFPTPVVLKEAESLTLPVDVLLEGLNKTSFCTAVDPLRPVLESVVFSIGSEVKFVATDTHRISEYKFLGYSGEPAKLQLPKKPITILKNALENGDVSITYNQVNARFEFGNVIFVCRLVDGNFPNYEAVLPRELPHRITINRDDIQASLKRVAIFSDSNSKQVVFDFNNNNLTLTSTDTMQSTDAKEEIKCQMEGQPFAIAFNHKMIYEIINNIQCNDLVIEVAENNRGAIITPADGLDENERVLFLQMPMALK